MDSVIELVGPMGCGQKMFMFFTGCVSALVALSFYSSVFFMAAPNFICQSSVTDNYANSSIESYTINNCSVWNNFTNKRNGSDYVCEFKDEYYNFTAINDWELICDKEYLPSNFLLMLMTKVYVTLKIYF